MRVIAVIERPAVIRQILDHLGLPTAAPQLRAPPALPDRGTPAGPPGGQGADQVRAWSSEPFFDDLPLSISGVGAPGRAREGCAFTPEAHAR